MNLLRGIPKSSQDLLIPPSLTEIIHNERRSSFDSTVKGSATVGTSNPSTGDRYDDYDRDEDEEEDETLEENYRRLSTNSEGFLPLMPVQSMVNNARRKEKREAKRSGRAVPVVNSQADDLLPLPVMNYESINTTDNR